MTYVPFDDDKLIITYPLLNDLLAWTQHRRVKWFISFHVSHSHHKCSWKKNRPSNHGYGLFHLVEFEKNAVYSPPVALAIRLRSVFLHRLTAIAPASTKYFRQRSSMPPVVRMTLAPAARIFSMRSLVISASLSYNKPTEVRIICYVTVVHLPRKDRISLEKEFLVIQRQYIDNLALKCLCTKKHLKTDLVVKRLTHYISLYDLDRKWSCFRCFRNLFENSFHVQCIHDISHFRWIFDNTNYEKIIWSQPGRWLISLSKAQGITIHQVHGFTISKGYCYKPSLESMSNKLSNK